MNLDIIAQLVQILREAPELGAIEVRRGLFGAWSSVRVSKAGHTTNEGGQHAVVAHLPAAPAVGPGSPGPPLRPRPIWSRSSLPWSGHTTRPRSPVPSPT